MNWSLARRLTPSDHVDSLEQELFSFLRRAMRHIRRHRRLAGSCEPSRPQIRADERLGRGRWRDRRPEQCTRSGSTRLCGTGARAGSSLCRDRGRTVAGTERHSGIGHSRGARRGRGLWSAAPTGGGSERCHRGRVTYLDLDDVAARYGALYVVVHRCDLLDALLHARQAEPRSR